MSRQKKPDAEPKQKCVTWKKIVYILLIVLACVCVIVLCLPLIQLLSTEDGQAEIVETLEGFGVFLPLAFVLLQVLQVVVAVIPGGPMPLIGEILFGKALALVLCLVGFFLGTLLIYYLVQWIGKPLVDKFVSKETYQKFDFLSDGKRLKWLIFIVFFVPGLPKDALTYLVAFNSSIKPLQLCVLTTVARAPATILTIFMGGSFWDGEYTVTLILIGVMLVLVALGLLVKHIINRRAETRESRKENSYGKSESDE